ncbi:type IV secretion system protein (plasmid) [Asticcacaulis sp. DW145]|uniref:virB8 family protein n=1 Tax=Asticcacaulis sp. DW145 TaxID=3095608 RepID=UPI0030911A27|nr:type IV secretion system protein [Asticcacaulis sp. DW145]
MLKKPATVSATGEQDFYDQSQDWEADRQDRLERSERRAWLVAGVASVIAAISVISMATLVPLKRTVPYVFEVDQATGNAELISAADGGRKVGYQDLLDKHWAKAYVTARETYMYRLLQADYDKTLSLSANDVGQAYAKQFDGPEALDKKLGTANEVRVKIRSITLSPDASGTKAVVRFQKTLNHIESGVVEAPQFYVATFAYEYLPSQHGREKDLIENPLGYRVTSYRVDSELSSEATPPAGQ